jgi:trimethylamine--corrinoid protein Co-methyltransferase
MARPDSMRAKRRQQSQSVKTLPWRTVVNPYPPIEVLSADQIEAIHHASLRVLAETGFRVDGENTRQILADAGAEVDHATMIVRCEAAMIEEYMAHAPSQFTIHCRNPDHNLLIGGNVITFEPVGGPSFVSDMDRGRRAGTMEEVRDFTKVCQSLDIIHAASGGAFEPMDLPPETRHLDTG